MADTVVMPKLGLTMKRGTVAAWLVPHGGRVRKGDALFTVETEKVNMDITAERDGIIHIVAKESVTVAPGTPIGYLLAEGELPPETATPANPAPEGGPATDSTRPPAKESSEPSEPPAGRRAASPAARRLAGQLGVDLVTVHGSGPGDRITERDVRAAASADAPDESNAEQAHASPLARRMAEDAGVSLQSLSGTGPGGRIVKADVEQAIAFRAGADWSSSQLAETTNSARPMTPMRRVIAERMTTSLTEMAQLSIGAEATVDDLVRLRSAFVEEGPEGVVLPSVTDFILRAVALALREHPDVNAAMGDGVIDYFDEIHLGVAVALAQGLVVPVIRHADRLGVRAIAEHRVDLAERARKSTVEMDELTGSTFTVSSLGGLGVRWFTPIINPPEAAILGVGSVYTGVEWRDGEVRPRERLPLSLTVDHRLIDGVPAAEFLRSVIRLLERPTGLLS